jgi:replicative DNA helicase
MVNEFEGIGDRLPPQNIEAEEAILGGILLDPEAISRVIDLLQPEMFYVVAHQEIFRTCLQLHNQSNPTDMMSVTTWLSDRDLLEKVGGQSKIVQLCDRTVSAINVDYYAQLVADKYMRRRLAEAGRETVNISYDTSVELPQALDLAEQKIFAVTQSRAQQGLTLAGDILTKTFQELENRFNLSTTGTSYPGLATGFYDLDAMTQGLQRSDLIIIAGRPSMGKCLVADSEIVLADGSVVTIADIYHRRQAELLTLKSNWQFGFTQPSTYVDDGIKPAFRVTTKLGRCIESTLTHPYLTINGWRALSELRSGDKIAVPRQLAVFGKEHLRECEIKLLGYLLGDGCLTDNTPEFINTNPLLQQDFTNAVQEFAKLKIRLDTANGTRAPSLCVSADRRGQPNHLTIWLRELGLWGKNSHTKFVPKIIFKLERSQLALFLNRLFATDGWACVLASGQSQLGYASVSEKLARQIQHLLLRFGIVSRLKKRVVKYRSQLNQAWQLDITDAISITTFISEIGIFGKTTNLEKVQDAISNRKSQTNCDLIPIGIWEQIKIAKGNESWGNLARRADIRGESNIHVGVRAPTRDRLLRLATALEDKELQNLAGSDIYWDEIVEIESVGMKQVYDLTIPETHNFVANDICVHNTAFSLATAYKMASLHKLPVAIFSLEMSKEQLVYRLLANASRIDSSRLRSGQISEHEWGTIASAIGTLSDLPIFIDDAPNPSIMELRSKARRLQSEKGGALGLILIDYLQLMEGSGSDNRVQELSRITRSLKGLARELQVPVIALSQLSRGVEARTNKRPMLSDLRESGSIEQDADLVINLYRDEYYHPDSPDRGVAEVIIAKHRNGPVGTVKLLFEPKFTWFENMATATQR